MGKKNEKRTTISNCCWRRTNERNENWPDYDSCSIEPLLKFQINPFLCLSHNFEYFFTHIFTTLSYITNGKQIKLQKIRHVCHESRRKNVDNFIFFDSQFYFITFHNDRFLQRKIGEKISPTLNLCYDTQKSSSFSHWFFSIFFDMNEKKGAEKLLNISLPLYEHTWEYNRRLKNLIKCKLLLSHQCWRRKSSENIEPSAFVMSIFIRWVVDVEITSSFIVLWVVQRESIRTSTTSLTFLPFFSLWYTQFDIQNPNKRNHHRFTATILTLTSKVCKIWFFLYIISTFMTEWEYTFALSQSPVFRSHICRWLNRLTTFSTVKLPV